MVSGRTSGLSSSLCCTKQFVFLWPPSLYLDDTPPYISHHPLSLTPTLYKPSRIKHPLMCALQIMWGCGGGHASVGNQLSVCVRESSNCCLAPLIAAFLFGCQSHRNRICRWALEWRRLTSTVNLLRAQMLLLCCSVCEARTCCCAQASKPCTRTRPDLCVRAPGCCEDAGDKRCGTHMPTSP